MAGPRTHTRRLVRQPDGLSVAVTAEPLGKVVVDSYVQTGARAAQN